MNDSLLLPPAWAQTEAFHYNQANRMRWAIIFPQFFDTNKIGG